MSEWIPVAKAKKPKKGMIRIYSYAPVVHATRPYASLRRANSFEPTMGDRVCDYVMDVTPPPVEMSE